MKEVNGLVFKGNINHLLFRLRMKPYYFTVLYLGICFLAACWYESWLVSGVSLVLVVLQASLFGICRYLGLQRIEPQSQLPSKKCHICKHPKPPRCYHCRECNICRFRMDHHCHFLGVCIYSLNTKSYIMFLAVNLFYTLTNIIYLVSRVPLIFRKDNFMNTCLGGLFGLISCWRFYEDCTLLWSQYELIQTNQTLVEILKKRKGKEQSFFKTFRELFGNSPLQSINPYQTQFNSSIIEETYHHYKPQPSTLFMQQLD